MLPSGLSAANGLEELRDDLLRDRPQAVGLGGVDPAIGAAEVREVFRAAGETWAEGILAGAGII